MPDRGTNHHRLLIEDRGIPSQIPPGSENLYVLKSKIVPPIPRCPSVDLSKIKAELEMSTLSCFARYRIHSHVKVPNYKHMIR